MDSTKKQVDSNYSPEQRRIFSRELKKKLVEEIECKRLKVRDVVNLYKVNISIVYRWLTIYSTTNRNGTRMVIESESSETKIHQLYARISELERNVGQKQLEIEFLNKVIEISSEEVGYDLKKKVTTKQLSGTG